MDRARIEALWDQGRDVPTDDDMTLVGDWPDLGGGVLFEKGSNAIEDVWTWFDEHHPRGVHYLLYERGHG